MVWKSWAACEATHEVMAMNLKFDSFAMVYNIR